MASHEPFGHFAQVMGERKARNQTGIISGFHFGNPEKKSHLDANATESHREYYMGEGGGFPQVRAMVSQVSQRSPMACPNTENVQNEF